MNMETVTRKNRSGIQMIPKSRLSFEPYSKDETLTVKKMTRETESSSDESESGSDDEGHFDHHGFSPIGIAITNESRSNSCESLVSSSFNGESLDSAVIEEHFRTNVAIIIKNPNFEQVQDDEDELSHGQLMS